MHYVDEGSGPIILFVHGTPTWSFLYRDFIKNLAQTHRCIAIDHIGFGRSEKPETFNGTPEAHAANLLEFIQKMELNAITLVVHDFGGPIGLGAALNAPDRIQQVVLFNSWLWATDTDPKAKKIDRMVNSTLGKLLYTRVNFSPRVLLKQGFHDKTKLSKSVHQHYIRPFSHKNSRTAVYSIAQALVRSSDWYQMQWEKMHLLNNKPWLVLWGIHDSFIKTEHLERWKKVLNNAQIHPLDCGHFVQEEATHEALKLLIEFVD